MQKEWIKLSKRSYEPQDSKRKIKEKNIDSEDNKENN